MLIHANIKKQIVDSFSDFGIISENELSEEQQLWLVNSNKCPACGNTITEYDLNCPDCGLMLKANKYSSSTDVSKYNDKTINYHYKKDTNKPK